MDRGRHSLFGRVGNRLWRDGDPAKGSAVIGSPEASDSAKGAPLVVENAPVLLPKVRILGCAAHDEADALALIMLRQLFDSTRYEVEIISEPMLTAEAVALIGEQSPAIICIAAIPPGGLAQTRYLCKRLRARFPYLKIAVGRWGMGSEDNNSILLAGADRVGITMIETREQMIQLSQSSPHSEAQSGATANPFSPVDALLKMT